MTRKKWEQDITWFDALQDARQGKAPDEPTEEAGKPVPNEARMRRDVAELLDGLMRSPKSSPKARVAAIRVSAALHGFRVKRIRENLSEHSEADLLELIRTVVVPALTSFGVEFYADPDATRR